MIIFFGPAGSGKSVQGQILAARKGWRWLSASQLLRDARDPEILRVMQSGTLVDYEKMKTVIGDALETALSSNNIILDGFPRSIEQARWLVEDQSRFECFIDVVFVLDVPTEELLKRLSLRGRADDNEKAINERLDIYDQEITPILDYFKEKNINIIHINGVGSIEQIHSRVIEGLKTCKLV